MTLEVDGDGLNLFSGQLTRGKAKSYISNGAVNVRFERSPQVTSEKERARFVDRGFLRRQLEVSSFV